MIAAKLTFYKYNVLVSLKRRRELLVALCNIITGNNIGRGDVKRHIWCELPPSHLSSPIWNSLFFRSSWSWGTGMAMPLSEA
jgi:hypothetical protein